MCIERAKTSSFAIPRIYAVSVADERAGRSLGIWIEANQPPDVIRRKLAEMLAKSSVVGAKEWAIRRQEGFYSLLIAEDEDIEHVSELALLLTSYGAIAVFAVSSAGGIPFVKRAWEALEAYQGVFKSSEDFFESMTSKHYKAPQARLPMFIRVFLDFKKMVQALIDAGYLITVEANGVVHYFTP